MRLLNDGEIERSSEMGGVYQQKVMGTLEELIKFIQDQIEIANALGLHLLSGTITQRPFPEDGFEWIAYYSK